MVQDDEHNVCVKYRIICEVVLNYHDIPCDSGSRHAGMNNYMVFLRHPSRQIYKSALHLDRLQMLCVSPPCKNEACELRSGLIGLFAGLLLN